MRFKCSYRPHKLWYRHKTMKIRRTTEKHHYMKMNLMLRQWTDSALWKIRLLDINHRALIHFPQYQMPIRPIPSWVVNRFAWLRCVALKFCQYTLDLFRLVMKQKTFFEVVLFGLSYFEGHIHNFSTFLNINVSKSFFSSKDEVDSNVNSPVDGSRSAEFALEIFELVKSRHLYYCTWLNFA